MKISHLWETISGLKGTKRFHTMTWYQFTSTLEKVHGVQVIGTGSFATVFWHPSWNFVYKIYEEDSGFAKYVDFCMANPNNPHLLKVLRPPRKVHAFHSRKKETSSTIWAVKLEFLTDLTKPAMQTIQSGRLWTAVQDYMENDGEINFSELAKGNEAIIKLFSQYDMIGLVQTLADLSYDVDVPPFDFDLHHRNVMMRGDTIVIIDPLVGDETDSPAHFRVNIDMSHPNAVTGPQKAAKPEDLFNS